MRRPARLSVTAVAALFGFSIGIFYLGRLLGLSGFDLWLFRIGLWLLGAAAAGLVLWYFLKFKKREPGADAPDEMDTAMLPDGGRGVNTSTPRLIPSIGPGKSPS